MINVFIVNINALGMFAGKWPLMIQPLSHSMRIAMITVVRKLTLNCVWRAISFVRVSKGTCIMGGVALEKRCESHLNDFL